MWDRKKVLISLAGLATLVILGVILISDLGDRSPAIADADVPELSVREFLPQLEGPYELVQSRVAIPVLLPTEIPDLENFWVTPGLLNDPSKYEFYIDRTRDCEGSGYCTTGSFGGELITEDTETLDERYADLDELPPDWPRSEEPKGALELAQGIEGQFIPWIGTAQCTESRVYWQENSSRYYVGIECGSQARVVEFANSVINNTARQ